MKLELENIKLRPLSENDISELAKLANNRNVSINLRDAFPFPYTLQNAKEFINICKKQNSTTTTRRKQTSVRTRTNCETTKRGTVKED